MGVAEYTIKRTIQAVAVVYVVATVVFISIRSVPGDPARLILGGGADADAIAAMR